MFDFTTNYFKTTFVVLSLLVLMMLPFVNKLHHISLFEVQAEQLGTYYVLAHGTCPDTLPSNPNQGATDDVSDLYNNSFIYISNVESDDRPNMQMATIPQHGGRLFSMVSTFNFDGGSQEYLEVSNNTWSRSYYASDYIITFPVSRHRHGFTRHTHGTLQDRIIYIQAPGIANYGGTGTNGINKTEILPYYQNFKLCKVVR